MHGIRWFERLFAFLMAFCSAALPAGADDTQNYPTVSLPAFPAQLPAGKEPGTYHFSEPVYVRFSQQTEFPVDYVIEDYAHHEVYRGSINNESPAVMACDLLPGSYQAWFKMRGKTKADYWDEPGSEFFIFTNGIRGFGPGWLSYFSEPAYTGPYGISGTILRRKIELIEPAPHAVLPDKTITLRWRPIPKITTYTVCIWPIQNPDHSKSVYAAERISRLVKGTSTPLPVGFRENLWYINSGQAYAWNVFDGDWEGEQGGEIARGEGVFSTAGGEQGSGKTSDDDFMRDESIEARLGLRLEQPVIPSSDPIQDYVIVVVIGSKSPALLAGLKPGDQIATVNGKPVRTLTEFRDCLAEVASGKTVTLGIVYDDKNPLKLLTWPCNMVPR